MDKRKFRKTNNKKGSRSEMQKHIEESIYHVYWRWSMITYILFNDPVRAQEVMNETANKIGGYEKTARKVILRIFSELLANPAQEIEKFIRYSLRQEISGKEDKGFSQTKHLLKHLLERNLISWTNHKSWLNKIEQIDSLEEYKL